MADDGTITGADLAAASGEPYTGSGSVATPDASAQPGGTTIQSAPSQDLSRTTEGPIPFEAHKTALANARTKAVEEALGGLTADQLRDVRGWYDRARANPDGFFAGEFLAHQDPVALLEKVVQSIQQHPQHSQRLASHAAKLLASRRGPGAEPAMVPIQLEDGSIVQMPRNPAEWLAWHQKQWMAQVDERMQPALTAAEAQKQAAQQAQQARAQHEWAVTTAQDALSWPGMDDPATRTAINAELNTMQIRGDDPAQVALALNAAYRKVVLPQLSQRERAKVVSDIHRQAGAATVNTGRASTHAPKTVDQMTTAEALRHFSTIGQ